MRTETRRARGPVQIPIVLAAVLAAWVPLYALWMLFILTYDDGATLSGAAVGGLTSIGLAALLGFGVWWLSGRLPWPDRVRPGFYLAHLALGSMYATVWLLAGYVVTSFRNDIPLLDLFGESRVLGWQFILGLVLYGLVAGVSYALRIRARLREQERMVARAEALAAEARLAALRARVNPHFLFNALHSVGALVRDDPSAAERAIERLGELLRHVLDDSPDDVLLEDEWQFTRAYLDLEKLRFGDRLRLKTDLAPAALAVPVPGMTLQPLVENAIRHAVEQTSEPVEVRIEAHQQDESLVLTVWDDGPGADPDRLDTATGSGLASLRERLAAAYADGATLSLDTAPGAGFCARLVLPVGSDSGARS